MTDVELCRDVCALAFLAFKDVSGLPVHLIGGRTRASRLLQCRGREPTIFPLHTSQRPLFQALGTPSADKKHVLYPGGHEIFATQRSQIVQEVVGWLGRYVGRVQ